MVSRREPTMIKLTVNCLLVTYSNSLLLAVDLKNLSIMFMAIHDCSTFL
jgi:hypothetical protein